MKGPIVYVGIAILILGILAYAYTSVETDEALGGLIEDQETKAPYRVFALPLIIVGAALIIIGAFMLTGQRVSIRYN